MPLLEQSIDNLLGGVSQAPTRQRSATQVEDSKNALALFSLGLMKRPPITYVGKLDTSSWDFDAAEIHRIDRDSDTKFNVVVEGGQVRVFDAQDGSSVTVNDETPDSQAYLNDTGDGYRMTTIGDTTIIVNRGVTVGKGTTKSEYSGSKDSYVTVEQADFSTTYRITLDGRDYSFTTIDQVDARARRRITTTFIASQLQAEIEGGLLGAFSPFDVTKRGSTLQIKPRTFFGINIAGNEDYEISVEDGLAGNGLHLAKGEVQSVEDLPPRAEHGARMKVFGDPSRDVDDFYVEYNAEIKGESDHGVWQETVGPKVLQDFDPSTMPHQLVRKGYFWNAPKEHEQILHHPKVEDVTESSEFQGFTEYRYPTDAPKEEEGDTPIFGNDSYAETVESIDGRTNNVTSKHKGRFRATVPNADGTKKRFTINYYIDASLVDTGVTVKVVFSKIDSSAGTRTIIDSVEHEPGDDVGITSKEIAGWTWDTGDEIEVELEYQDGFQPGFQKTAILGLPGERSGEAGYSTNEDALKVVTKRKVRVTYNYGSTWPEGTDVHITVDDNEGNQETFTHTVSSGGESDDQVATAIKDLVNASVNFQATNPSSNIVEIGDDASENRPDIVETKSQLASDVFLVSGESFSTDEFVNDTLVNLTDGSEGTITSNGSTWIQASLSGGSDNLYNPGDKIQRQGSGEYFVLQPIDWDLREAGDDDTNPFPSFTENTIKDVFFYRNRLGFVSQENVVLSRSGDLFQFFRTSVADLLDDDRIDIRSAHKEISLFHSGFIFDDELHLWTEQDQFVLGSGEGPLTARTVTLDHISSFPNDPDVPPTTSGEGLFFVRKLDGNTRVYRFSSPTRNQEARAQDLTRNVPAYLTGDPRDISVDSGLGVLTVATAGDPDAIFAFTWTQSGQETLHAGWNRWELPNSSVVGKLSFVAGTLAIVSSHGTDGTYISHMDLDVSVAPDTDERGRYLDRRESFSSGTLNAGDTDWTLSYAPQEPANVRVFDRDSDTVYNPSVSGSTVTVQGVDLSAANVWIGTIAQYSVTLSDLAIRDRKDRPEGRGRLQLKDIEIDYHDTTDFDVEYTPAGRSTYTKSLPLADPRGGTLRVPTKGKADGMTIKLKNTTPGGVRISGLSWRGYFSRRSKRV